MATDPPGPLDVQADGGRLAVWLVRLEHRKAAGCAVPAQTMVVTRDVPPS